MQNTVTVKWEIKRKPISIPTLAATEFDYTGSEVTPTIQGYSETTISTSGNLSAIQPGNYSITFTPKSNWCWTDGTTDPKTITWSIQTYTVALPTQAEELTYNGDELSPLWTAYDTTRLVLGGVTTGTNAGTYTATFTPLPGFTWEDGTNSAKNATWEIKRAPIAALPSQSGTLTYTGSEQTVQWLNYNSTQLTVSGTVKSTNAGSFNASFTPTANYCWGDNTTAAKTISWTIGRAKITKLPSQKNTLACTGTSQTVTWNDYNSSQLTLGGSTTGTNAATYTATFTPKSNWSWNDGSTTAKEVTWTIDKGDPGFTIDKTSITCSGLGASYKQEITVTSKSTGAVSATSSATSKATVAVDGKKVVVTPVADGSTTITITIAGDSNYYAPTGSKTCSVTISSIYTGTSKAATAAQFQQVIQAGKGPSTFAVGDLVTIGISGTLDPCTFSGNYYPAILGFNHNKPTEGTGNYVDLQFCVSEDGTTPLCFCPASGGYKMNDTNTNVGGPKESKMYKTTLPALLNLINTSWKNTFIDVTKYVDNTGNQSTTAANVTALVSKLFLLSEFEVFGTRSYANENEKTKQAQYDLYKNGAIKIRKSFVDASTARYWWLSSPISGSAASFCIVYNFGSANINSAIGTAGLAPGFRIG